LKQTAKKNELLWPDRGNTVYDTQGYNARKVISINLSHKKSMKYSGHRRLLSELSKLSKFNAFNLIGY